MTEILFQENGVIGPEAISKEEDLEPIDGFIIDPPLDDRRCEVCGRHIKELKSFGGPGDPVVGDFTGRLLVWRYRRLAPYDQEAQKTWAEAEKEVQDPDDTLPWLINKYGKKKAEQIHFLVQAYDSVDASWECRDCIVLDDTGYFEKLRQRYQEQGNE